MEQKVESEETPALPSRNILIDCGKYFWASALKTFAKAGVDHLDAVVLTHAHADAFFGVDDLRDFANIREGGRPLTVYIREQDLPELRKTFPYLMNKGQTANNMHVPALLFEFYPESSPFDVSGLLFHPLQVSHGPGVTCSAFAFGNCVYMADVNDIPSSAKDFIFSHFDHSLSLSTPLPSTKPRLDILILDALWPEKSYNSHFSLKDAIRHFDLFRPSKGYTTGMSHEIEYNEYSQVLKRVSDDLKLDLELAWDGLIDSSLLLPPSSPYWLARQLSSLPKS